MWFSRRFLAVLFVCSLSLSFAPVLAQTPVPNPTPDACGMPLAGSIIRSVTYNLVSDCTLTGSLEISNAHEVVTVTINGAGHTIGVDTTVTAFSILKLANGETLNLNQVTVNGGGSAVTRSDLIIINGTLNSSAVTITGNTGGVALALGENGNATLSSTLFVRNRSYTYNGAGNGVALNLTKDATVTMTDTVFRDNRYAGGAVRVSTDGATLTANGCLGFSGNLPYDIVGPWTDNSSGPCSGTIGNGGAAVIAAPGISSCGLPLTGVLDSSATYTLKSDCTATDELIISPGVNITIDGRGHSIRGGASGSTATSLWFENAGNARLTFYNVTLDLVHLFLFGPLDAERITVRNSSRQAIYNFGNVRVTASLFENNTNSRTGAAATVLMTLTSYSDGSAVFRDSIFRNNTGGGAVLYSWNNAPITLEGCITFDSNTPANTFGNVTDESTGSCDVPVGPDPALPPLVPSARLDIAPAQQLPGNCFQRLGAIGLLCRIEGQLMPTIEVWGVTPESTGYFILRLTQAQVDAAAGGKLVASSADGRVGVRVWPNRDVTFAMGPNFEGKVHHVTLERHLLGMVIGTVDTFTGLPGVPATAASDSADADIRQPARADGSILHVVRAGETLTAIARAYDVDQQAIIARNRLGGGDLIVIGQELVIRDAA